MYVYVYKYIHIHISTYIHTCIIACLERIVFKNARRKRWISGAWRPRLRQPPLAWPMLPSSNRTGNKIARSKRTPGSAMLVPVTLKLGKLKDTPRDSVIPTEPLQELLAVWQGLHLTHHSSRRPQASPRSSRCFSRRF